ncbi:hypothetical protein [Cupriavidus gilardii]|uniref:Uncharacterized protein n=1 Tax=Cupriavidus gilardii TaxID=82541 RepID=A0A849BKR4_9BURK|nr:hypothetical protein [Cupriavidus gilardii]KAB0592766.1 hypothetical protein F7Q96_26120 [Cupriavidus gilardii]NNH14313.1 hypothetical protein [Cupriavidus gilardii]
MSNIIELARFRGTTSRQPAASEPVGTITIKWQSDGTHAYTISGQYARSFSLTMQALNQVAARVATDVVRSDPIP